MEIKTMARFTTDSNCPKCENSAQNEVTYCACGDHLHWKCSNCGYTEHQAPRITREEQAHDSSRIASGDGRVPPIRPN